MKAHDPYLRIVTFEPILHGHGHDLRSLLTKGTMSGRLAAEALNGIDSQLLKDIQAMGNPEQLPPQPILSMGIWAKVKWWEWMQRSEM